MNIRYYACAIIAMMTTAPISAKPSLEQRVQLIEDRYAIEQLVTVRYATALDNFDAKAYAALFTEDGVLDIVGKEFHGRAEIENMFAHPELMGPPPQPGSPPPPPMPKFEPGQAAAHHVITNVVVTINGNEATSSSFVEEVVLENGQPIIKNSARYKDILRKNKGNWLFVRREIKQDFPPPLPR